MALAAAGAPVDAELLPVGGDTKITETLKYTFEILPATAGGELPEDIRKIEGARLEIEEFSAESGRYIRMSLALPLPTGGRRERVVFYRDDQGALRMLGYHSILRKDSGPEGETWVFDSGGTNPLTGRAAKVPADSYSFLGLFGALRGLSAAPKETPLSLWVGDGKTLPASVSLEGKETLELFGTDIPALKYAVAPKNAGAPRASYWFGEQAPHSFLQYEGPADFVTAESPQTTIMLRATSSSEQNKQLLRRQG